jgi:hypothetical protein
MKCSSYVSVTVVTTVDLGTKLTNQNYIQEEIKSRLKLGNAWMLFGAKSFVFQFAMQKFKDQDI